MELVCLNGNSGRRIMPNNQSERLRGAGSRAFQEVGREVPYHEKSGGLRNRAKRTRQGGRSLVWDY